MSLQSVFPTIPAFEVILVNDPNVLRKSKRFKDYELPPMNGAIAKAIHINHSTSNEHVVLIYYPGLLEDQEIDAFCTLVHEGSHAYDFIADHFGYGPDTELRAYMLENIFRQLVEGYGRLKRKKDKHDAKRA